MAGALYETVDASLMPRATPPPIPAFTQARDLAGIYNGTLLYGRADRSEGFAGTCGFIDRRLAAVPRLGRLGRDLVTVVERLPNPLRLLRPLR